MAWLPDQTCGCGKVKCHFANTIHLDKQHARARRRTRAPLKRQARRVAKAAVKDMREDEAPTRPKYDRWLKR